jgi:hypothetical protein
MSSLPAMSPKLPVFERVWPTARDKEVTQAVEHEFLLYNIGEFLWRRHVAFPSKISLLKSMEWRATKRQRDRDRRLEWAKCGMDGKA